MFLTGCSDDDEIITNIAGINIKRGITDSGGRESFQDDQVKNNTADLYITNEFGKPLSDTDIVFMDGYGFEPLIMFHSNLEPRWEIPLHHSGHHYSLTPAPLQILHHDRNGKERSKLAAQNTFNWSKNWQNTGCYNKEEVRTVVKPGLYLIKRGLSYFTVGISNKFVDKLASYLVNQMGSNDVAEMRSFIPSKHGIYGLTSISTVEIRNGSCGQKENIETKPNNECNGAVFCDYFNNSLEKWNIKGKTSINNGWLEMDGANILAKTNISCANTVVEYHASSQGNYGLFLGNQIALYADGKNNRLEFVCGSYGRKISLNVNNNHPVKIKVGNSLNVNGNGIVCKNRVNKINFSASSKFKLDYVELRCQ